MLLNSEQIAEFVKESEFSKRAQVGIDLSVAKIETVNSTSVVYMDKTYIDPYGYKTLDTVIIDQREVWVLEPGVYSITFNEGVKIPPHCAAKITHRSSLYRTGTSIESPWWDPGFECDNMNTTMIVSVGLILEKNARAAQIAFHLIDKVGEQYNGQFQNLSTAYKS